MAVLNMQKKKPEVLQNYSLLSYTWRKTKSNVMMSSTNFNLSTLIMGSDPCLGPIWPYST